jgi:hypothetical protein
MADLAARSDRGQLVLVAGLAIAVALLALILLLNTAIYTQNLATRDANVADEDAIEYRNTVVSASSQIVDAENQAEYDSYDDVRENTSAGIERTDTLLRQRHAEHGTSADINDSSITHHQGRLVRQTNDSREFNDAGGLSDWTMAVEIQNTRQYTATVDRSSLNTTDAANATADGFHVRLLENGTATDWSAAVYTNDTTNDIALAVEQDGAAEPTQVCSVDQATATVDFTDGTLAGEPCPGYTWREGVDAPYDITYRNGDQASGSYNVTVNTTGVATVTEPVEVNADPTGGSPYAVPAVYSITFSLTYETAEIRYVNTVRVAPDEYDG